MTLRFRNRKGEQISADEMHRLAMLNDGEYLVVKQTDVGPYWVSTVWCPLAQEDDRLFETAIFGNDRNDELTRQNYATEADAVVGHNADVEGLQGMINAGIDFAGIVEYLRGDRDDLPPAFREVIDRIEPEDNCEGEFG